MIILCKVSYIVLIVPLPLPKGKGRTNRSCFPRFRSAHQPTRFSYKRQQLSSTHYLITVNRDSLRGIQRSDLDLKVYMESCTHRKLKKFWLRRIRKLTCLKTCPQHLRDSALLPYSILP